MFNLGNYADIETLIADPCFAESKGLTVKKCYIPSPKLQKLEEAIRAIPSDAENWREQVDSLKRSIKEEKANLVRYLIKYKKPQLNATNYKTLGLFRSVITDGKIILSFAPPKSLPQDIFTAESLPEDRIYQEFCEGTMINMYYDSYTNEWEIATRSNIGARCKFYNPKSNQTFRRMFLDAFTKQQFEFHDFDRNNCYSFVLQHPENRIVIPYTVPKIVLTNVYRCSLQQVQEIMPDKWLNFAPPIPQPPQLVPCKYYEAVSLQSLDRAFSQSKVIDYTKQGAIIRDRKHGTRCKIRNPHYEYVRHLRGNNPKLQYQYYYLRKNGQVKKYLMYYPEDLDTFTKFRDQMHNWTLNLHRNYIGCYIQKERPLREYPFEYRSHMYKLHDYYRNILRDEGNAVTRRIVINYVNELPPNHLMASINYPLRHVKMKAKREELQNATC